MSLISLTANHCCTAHASISSGATVVQNIILTLAKSLPIRPCGGTFGWTDVHAQMKVVKIQLHAILNSVLGGCGLESVTASMLLSQGREVVFEDGIL